MGQKVSQCAINPVNHFRVGVYVMIYLLQWGGDKIRGLWNSTSDNKPNIFHRFISASFYHLKIDLITSSYNVIFTDVLISISLIIESELSGK